MPQTPDPPDPDSPQTRESDPNDKLKQFAGLPRKPYGEIEPLKTQTFQEFRPQRRLPRRNFVIKADGKSTPFNKGTL